MTNARAPRGMDRRSGPHEGAVRVVKSSGTRPDGKSFVGRERRGTR
jgi:hypothetical protein